MGSTTIAGTNETRLGRGMFSHFVTDTTTVNVHYSILHNCYYCWGPRGGGAEH